jgi:hypothetical protein
VDLYFDQEEQFQKQIQRCAKVYDNLVVLDLRNEDTIYAGNRFAIYALFPECNISRNSIIISSPVNLISCTSYNNRQGFQPLSDSESHLKIWRVA